MCESSCTTSLRNVFQNPLDRRTRSWTLDLTTFWKLYKSIFLYFLTQRPFISSSFWSPPCFPHLLSHYLKPKPNPAMQESNHKSPTPTKWCISRLTRMNRSGYNNSETNMRSNRKKKNSGGEAEGYGFKRKSTSVLPGSSTPKLRMKGLIESRQLQGNLSFGMYRYDFATKLERRHSNYFCSNPFQQFIKL
ncbi:uncharacterized protein LOC126621525 isoform X3 [Malus sylvestris]|uniref:uncharacterized protein LOC126621525 isoform X3 n=1 Tax=Malus sylvestris TaxID=3752 RepID=UPI0021AC7E57|nr:uncharacterized protein LOC126621525 isoform X3 [Malus sylvestris]